MKKRTALFLLEFFFAAVVASSAWAGEVRISKFYDIGKTSGQPSFVQETTIERSSAESFISTAKITDSAGKMVMTEKVIVAGGKITFQYVEQLQTEEAWQLDVQNGNAVFKTYKLTGGNKSEFGSGRSEKIKGDFINGPLTESFIGQNWQPLLNGLELKVRFSVLELEESVGFKFFKEGQMKRGGKEVLVVKMKPSNFLISMLVDPIQIEFDFAEKKMVYYKGRTPLKTKQGGKWKPYDAEIIYE